MLKRKTSPNIIEDIYEKLYAAYGPQLWWPSDGPFETAVGAVLTQNTNWKNVEKAIAALKAPDGLGVLDAITINDMPHERLAELIKPSGYFNVKARRLKALTSWLARTCPGGIRDLMDGDTKHLREELLAVNGIGPETADSILLYALEKPVFVIDAYTRRVLSRHGIMDYDRPYDEFQRLFHECLPPDISLYNEYHALLVRVGKLHCRKTPLCAKGIITEGAALQTSRKGTCPLDPVITAC
jgi:endonuclease-3 related protein